MLTETTSVLVVGDRMIQFGYKRKTEAVCNIDFRRRFSVPPTVVVTPAWEHAGREVGHAETIGRVSRTGVRLYSSNAARNYFVSWIAVGYLSGGADENTSTPIHPGHRTAGLTAPRPRANRQSRRVRHC